MNILIPHSWLKEYLKTSATPKKIAECLSLCGPSVERINKVDNDYVYDIEVTTNRVDMMSVIGIAREAATILPQFNIKAKFIPPKITEINTPKKSLPITIKDTNHTCRRILGVVLDNVNLESSSSKVRTRLEAAGLRSLNNVVDITNYIMTEIGHPTHVFDYDRIKSKKLILRKSKPGEKIISLENKEYTLPGGDNVIDDGTGKIIDLPGIIGTANSVVINSTKRILFFLETNDSAQIRKTSMTLGIRTVAASLNEKWVDPELAMVALKKGISMYQELTGATVASKIYDIYPNPVKPRSITINLQLIKDKLGVDIEALRVSNILKSLGFNNHYQKSSDKFIIEVPTFRQNDVNVPEDIVEEVARIYGYQKIPSELMPGVIPTNYPDENFNLEYKIKTWLASMGLNELYTNSMVSKTLAKQSSFLLEDHLKIKNTLSSDWAYLRRSLIPSHHEAILNNSQSENISFFEIANTYHPQPGKLPKEKLELIIISKLSYLKVKGFLDSLMHHLHLSPQYIPSQDHAKIMIDSQIIGKIGSLKSDSNIQVITLNLRPILKLAKSYPSYQPIALHPPIIEELTFTLPPQTYLQPVVNSLQKADKLINSVELTKTYQHNFTFKIIYQDQEKPLTDKVIAPIRKKLANLIKVKHLGKLVGKLK